MSKFSSQNLIESIGKIKKTLLLLHQYIVGGGAVGRTFQKLGHLGGGGTKFKKEGGATFFTTL